jgi:7-keto-8-aminopelargonate synthetase-like enzyme
LDVDARSRGLYGFEIRRCERGRRVEIVAADGPRCVIDFATNSAFDLNTRPEVVEGSIAAIKDFGASHASIAAARAQTGVASEITKRLSAMKGGDSAARVYPTTFAANTAAAAGLAAMDATGIVHTNAHATVQLATDGALEANRIIRTKNTAGVAAAFSMTTRRPVFVVEDGLYSMGRFSDFEAIQRFLDGCPRGMAWFDDAHSVGLGGRDGRGETMDRMERYTDRCVVTGSFGKAFGAAGGFLVGPAAFVEGVLGGSVADRFSCNLDIGAQGAVVAAMKLLATPGELESLQRQLAARLQRLDGGLAAIGVEPEQALSSIPFRVVPFSGPGEAIRAAGVLLDAGFLTTPVYYPTIARGLGAIRLSVSTGHAMADVDALIEALIPHLTGRQLSRASA